MDPNQPLITESSIKNQSLHYGHSSSLKEQHLLPISRPNFFKVQNSSQINHTGSVQQRISHYESPEYVTMPADTKTVSQVNQNKQLNTAKNFNHHSGNFHSETLSYSNTGYSNGSFVRLPTQNERKLNYPVQIKNFSSIPSQHDQSNPQLIQTQIVRPIQRVIFGSQKHQIPSTQERFQPKMFLPSRKMQNHQSIDYMNQAELKNEVYRWQNRFEDLNSKYNDLKSTLNRHQSSKIEQMWILEEENKLLKEKVKIMQQRERKYCVETEQKIARLIQYHQDATVKQCQLLIDRYRLQSKLINKK